MNVRLQLHSIGVIALCAVSCVRTAPSPKVGYLVSSEGSQYSPTATIQISSTRDGDRLRLHIDTATLTVSGNFAAPAPLALRHVYLTAYVATTNERPMALALPDTGRCPDRRGWRALSRSDSVLLAEELRHGERRALGRLSFTLPLPLATSTLSTEIRRATTLDVVDILAVTSQVQTIHALAYPAIYKPVPPGGLPPGDLLAALADAETMPR